MECPVRCETYTARNPCTRCPYCQGEACLQCQKTFILGVSLDPHCMHCRRPWPPEVLASLFPASFRTGDLRKHTVRLLAYFPETLKTYEVYVATPREATTPLQVAMTGIDDYVNQLEVARRKIVYPPILNYHREYDLNTVELIAKAEFSHPTHVDVLDRMRVASTLGYYDEGDADDDLETEEQEQQVKGDELEDGQHGTRALNGARQQN